MASKLFRLRAPWGLRAGAPGSLGRPGRRQPKKFESGDGGCGQSGRTGENARCRRHRMAANAFGRGVTSRLTPPHPEERREAARLEGWAADKVRVATLRDAAPCAAPQRLCFESSGLPWLTVSED